MPTTQKLVSLTKKADTYKKEHKGQGVQFIDMLRKLGAGKKAVPLTEVVAAAPKLRFRPVRKGAKVEERVTSWTRVLAHAGVVKVELQKVA